MNKNDLILKIYTMLEDITEECGSYQKEKAMEIINLLERELKN
jgi:hypothetical protein